jgi:hypothetical protein
MTDIYPGPACRLDSPILPRLSPEAMGRRKWYKKIDAFRTGCGVYFRGRFHDFRSESHQPTLNG